MMIKIIAIRDTVSPSARRAWIEIDISALLLQINQVALRTEGVDRNSDAHLNKYRPFVALRTEGVDRNDDEFTHFHWLLVALRTEGVDRNRTSRRT